MNRYLNSLKKGKNFGSDRGIEGRSALKQGELVEKSRVILADKRAHGRQKILLLDDVQDMYPVSMEGIIRHVTNAHGEGEEMLQMVLLGNSDMKG